MDLLQETIVWDKRFILGIPLIDKQHELIVNVANELNYASNESPNAANDRFRDAAGCAVASIHNHFSTEEKLMVLLGFHGSFNHKREHENFIREVLEQSKQHKSGKKIVPRIFVHFFRDWLLSHFVVSDRVFVNYILDMKRNGQLRQLLESKPDIFPLSA